MLLYWYSAGRVRMPPATVPAMIALTGVLSRLIALTGVPSRLTFDHIRQPAIARSRLNA